MAYLYQVKGFWGRTPALFFTVIFLFSLCGRGGAQESFFLPDVVLPAGQEEWVDIPSQKASSLSPENPPSSPGQDWVPSVYRRDVIVTASEMSHPRQGDLHRGFSSLAAGGNPNEVWIAQTLVHFPSGMEGRYRVNNGGDYEGGLSGRTSLGSLPGSLGFGFLGGHEKGDDLSLENRQPRINHWEAWGLFNLSWPQAGFHGTGRVAYHEDRGYQGEGKFLQRFLLRTGKTFLWGFEPRVTWNMTESRLSEAAAEVRLTMGGIPALTSRGWRGDAGLGVNTNDPFGEDRTSGMIGWYPRISLYFPLPGEGEMQVGHGQEGFFLRLGREADLWQGSLWGRMMGFQGGETLGIIEEETPRWQIKGRGGLVFSQWTVFAGFLYGEDEHLSGRWPLLSLDQSLWLIPGIPLFCHWEGSPGHPWALSLGAHYFI